jgi:hypothetical protein
VKLHEILQLPSVLSGDVWIIPKDWMPCPMAFSVRGKGSAATVVSVPSPRGGEVGISPYVSALSGEWMVVSPDTINAYRAKLYGVAE